MFSSNINFQPLVNALVPYAAAAIGGLIIAVGGFAVAALRKYTGITVNQNLLMKFEREASMQAGKWVAQAAVDWPTQAVDAKNPFVAMAANDAISHFAEDASDVGMTPDKLSDMIVGEIGKLQAHALSATPTAISNTEPKQPAGPDHQA